VIDDHDRPLVTNPFFCGERVYEFEMMSFSRTVADNIFLPGFFTGEIDKETGLEIRDQTKVDLIFPDYP
jgi:hypothetical protein